MSLVSLQDAHFDYGRERILRGATVAILAGVKCALVGANGAGKTTLLGIIAGELALQGGARQVTGRTRVQVLRQDTTLEGGEAGARPLIEAVGMRAFTREHEIESALEDVARRIAAATSADEQAALAHEQGRLQDEFERRDGYAMQSRLEATLRGVGLLPRTWTTAVDRLSGGERRRAALAAVLLSGADLMLLDEPTNHLDLESCEWLEGFLLQSDAAAVIVSHDRHFLDRVTTRTLHLDRGRVVSYSGNYSFYDEQSRLRYEQDLNAWERQQARLRQTEDYIRRNIEGQKTKQAQSRRRQMDKEEKLERPSAEPGLYRFHLQPVRPSGGTVLEAHGLGKRYGERALLDGFALHVSRGDRIGIVGPNGCGKSTLLKMFAGRTVPDAGRVVVGHNVDLGYYDQDLASVADHNTVIQEAASVDPTATLGELRSFLAAFGFGEDLYDRPVGQLSGGERGRLALLRLIKEGHNTLLLDEPTNHLDIRSRESLEAALAEYAGTLIVVSHDRRFLDKIVDKLVVFPSAGQAGEPRVVLGNWAEWVRRRAEEKAAAAAPETKAERPRAAAAAAVVAPAAGGRTPLSKNEQTRRRQWIAEVEATILALEEERDAAMAEMGSGAAAPDRLAELGRRCNAIDAELAGCMARWEQWNTEIEEGLAAN
ncbi:MAG TPA: ABC-F family ATP-binding cassette domain-containing protein [Candidatus Krumholzibacteria bacterium]|nr:ABC-F family ATP-binding cassette domain-containing protein [Candidatus Krumholzibacteria bacterium]